RTADPAAATVTTCGSPADVSVQIDTPALERSDPTAVRPDRTPPDRTPPARPEPAHSLRRLRQLGTIGSAVLVVGGVFAGVPPVNDPVMEAPILERLREPVAPGVMVVFIGVCML